MYNVADQHLIKKQLQFTGKQLVVGDIVNCQYHLKFLQTCFNAFRKGLCGMYLK